jgi:hypothetical protein
MVRINLDLPCLKRQPAVLTVVEGGGSRLKLNCGGNWTMSIPGPLLANQEEIWSSSGFIRCISLNNVVFQATDNCMQARFIACAPYQKSGLLLVFSSFKVTKNKRKRGINFRECWVKRVKFDKGSDTVLNITHSSRPIMAWWFLFSQPVIKKHELFPFSGHKAIQSKYYLKNSKWGEYPP